MNDIVKDDFNRFKEQLQGVADESAKRLSLDEFDHYFTHFKTRGRPLLLQASALVGQPIPGAPEKQKADIELLWRAAVVAEYLRAFSQEMARRAIRVNVDCLPFHLFAVSSRPRDLEVAWATLRAMKTIYEGSVTATVPELFSAPILMTGNKGNTDPVPPINTPERANHLMKRLVEKGGRLEIDAKLYFQAGGDSTREGKAIYSRYTAGALGSEYQVAREQIRRAGEPKKSKRGYGSYYIEVRNAFGKPIRGVK